MIISNLSYMEIYNEKLRDLLDFDSHAQQQQQQQQQQSQGKLFQGPAVNFSTTKSSGSNLKIREHPNKGIYVQNLIQYSVSDLKDVLRSMSRGNQLRFESKNLKKCYIGNVKISRFLTFLNIKIF